MNESFSSNPDSSLYTVSNVVWYGALTHHSQYTQLFDSSAGLLSGSLSGGNINGLYKAYKSIQQGRYIYYNGMVIYSTVNSYYQFWQPIIQK